MKKRHSSYTTRDPSPVSRDPAPVNRSEAKPDGSPAACPNCGCTSTRYRGRYVSPETRKVFEYRDCAHPGCGAVIQVRRPMTATEAREWERVTGGKP